MVIVYMCSIFNEQYSVCPICVQYLSVKYRQFIVLGTVLRLKNNYLTFLTTIFQTMVLSCTKHVSSDLYFNNLCFVEEKKN